MQSVRPKKSLGQHFLHDQNVAQKIVSALRNQEEVNHVLEIGPGMGVLTQHLITNEKIRLAVVEIDRDSVAYLKQQYPALRIIEGDFLELDLSILFATGYSIIGNFPYNISSQIFFSILQYKNSINQVVCMLQKEVADRIAAPSSSKTYGILSVLLQAYFSIEYLFRVSPGVFNPPPKVMSAVIRLQRNSIRNLPCNEEYFVKVVKQGFNNRRKTLRNALKSLKLHPDLDPGLTAVVSKHKLLDKRAEQLDVADFIQLTQMIEDSVR